jgi:uncharacterized membrane protein
MLALALLFSGIRVAAAWVLIVFFILILPANINAALQNIDYQHGTTDGPGTEYLWFRVPLQIIFILWTWIFCVRLSKLA